MAARATQKRAISAAHEGHAVSDKTAHHHTEWAIDPFCWIMFVVWKEYFGDVAIGRSDEPRVDGTKHLAGALVTLRCQTRVVRHAFAGHRVPKTLKRCFPVWHQVVEDDVNAKRTLCVRLYKQYVIALAAQFEPEKIPAMLDYCAQTQHFAGDGAALRGRPNGEYDCAGIDLRGPENRLRQRACLWIDREIATPIARRKRARHRR